MDKIIEKAKSGAIITLVLLLLLQWCNYKKDVDRVNDNLRASQSEVKLWTDKFGRSHAEKERIKLTLDEIRNSIPSLLDSIKVDFTNVKPKTITNILTVTKHTRDTIYFDKPIDCPDFSLKLKDKWASIDINSKGFTYTVMDSIALVNSTKRHGFLNSKRIDTVEALSYNPNTTLTGVTSIDIIRKERNWGIGVMAGYGMTSTGLSPTLSVGVYRRLY